MTIEDILKHLPDSISWLVLFEIEGFRAVADDNVMKEMYFLNPEVELNHFNYVILTSQGRYLSRSDKSGFIHGETLDHYDHVGENNLYNSYSNIIRDYAVNDAHSFAVAEDPEFGKVLLYIELKDGKAHSEGLFRDEPTQQFYELLQSVGVKYLGGEESNGLFRAKYLNRLSTHIMSGTINDYSRTDNCNVFFFRHGRIDDFLKTGLFTAAQKRIALTREWVKTDLESIAESCLSQKLAMTWLPPAGNETFPFGDLVPKGFVNRALKAVNGKKQEELEKDIIAKKLRGLWTFETDDLETSTDSVLVLQSVEDKEAAKQLNQFFDGHSGLYPQLWSMQPKDGEMIYDSRKRHWCQADIATTAYAVALQAKHKVELKEEMVDFVLRSFDSRSGLYFANPYMVDWIYAQLLTRIDNTEELQNKLKNELLHSLNKDFSFGQYDKVLSSCFGVLALLELGYQDSVIAALQLYIINNYRSQKNGSNVPFYSSLINDDGHTDGRTISVNDYVLDLSLHEDSHDMIYTAMVCLALDHEIAKDDLNENTLIYTEAKAHGRYLCTSIKEYTENFALVPYMKPDLPLE